MRKIVLLLLAGIVSWGASAQTMCEIEMSKKNYKEYQKAYEMYERGQYTASTGILKKIVSDEPEVAEPYFLLGLIAAKKESLAALDKNMSKVLALCPDFPDARLHYYMGLVHYSYERYEQAVISFDNFFGLAEMEMDGRYDAYIEEAESYSYWSRTLAKAYLNPVPFEPNRSQRIFGLQNCRW